jgi:hypothetical protein
LSKSYLKSLWNFEKENKFKFSSHTLKLSLDLVMAFEVNLTSIFLVSIKRGMEFVKNPKIPKDQTPMLIGGIRT